MAEGDANVLDVEVWRDVPGTAGIRASSLGRVQFPSCKAVMPHGKIRDYITKPIWGAVTRSKREASHVYRGACYRGKNYKLHQLVCAAFHGPAPFPRAVVMHLDEDGLNNRPENLRWGTQKENLNMPKIKAFHRSRVGDRNPFIVGKRRRQRNANVLEQRQ